MYLQPYNNPRAGLYSLQRKLHSSTLNLATSREPQASRPASINEGNSPQLDSAGPSRGAPGRLHKARSLDVLTETWSQTQIGRDGRERSMTKTSSEFSFSGLSSSSESSSSLKDEEQGQRRKPDVSKSGNRRHSHRSSTSSGSSGSVTSKDNETASVTPRVPPRPRAEEILTRCTTMTRKAALATKTRLQIQPSENIQGR